ncbi:MAG: hypothetical protein ACLFUS_11310 [Candidatus Sumerlaeia bacterium]
MASPRFFCTSILITTLLLISACQSGIGIDPAIKGKDIEYNTAYFLDKGLSRKIKVQITDGKRTPGGTLEVIAVLRNPTNKPITLEGRAFFYDINKIPSDGPTIWKKVFIPAHTTETYSALSTRVQAVAYYHIEFRKVR